MLTLLYICSCYIEAFISKVSYEMIWPRGGGFVMTLLLLLLYYYLLYPNIRPKEKEDRNLRDDRDESMFHPLYIHPSLIR